MPFQHQQTVKEDGTKTLTVFIPGSSPLVVHGDNPNYDEAYKLASEGNPQEDADKLIGLTRPREGVEKRFRELSDRVAVRGRTLFFDGDPLHNSLAEHIVRSLAEDGDIATPLVNFLERINMNPSKRSREQLYDWLNNRFTITDEGKIVMYKGVVPGGTGGYESRNSGHAIVDGLEFHNSAIPNNIGSVITIPRSEVDDDPNALCSTGLHTATFDFAQRFAWNEGVVLKVEVDPRDVVSVPNESGSEKVRVCRYTVIEVVDKPVDEPIERTSTTPKENNEKKETGVKNTTRTRDALRKLAAKLGIEGRGRMNKAQLEEAIAKHSVANLSRDELRREAARLDIAGRGRMNKNQLQAAVARARTWARTA